MEIGISAALRLSLHSMQNSLAIIGAGRVGRALGRRLREAGWRIGAVLTRSKASARRAVRFIGAGKPFAGMTWQILPSQVILITTPDDQIALAARDLARIGEEELRGRVVLHTSGAMDSGALEPLWGPRRAYVKLNTSFAFDTFPGDFSAPFTLSASLDNVADVFVVKAGSANLLAAR